jgi:hypothetical protein
MASTQLKISWSIAAESANELGYGEHIDQAEGFWRTVAWERDHYPENIDPEWFDYAAEDKALSR